MIHTRSSISLCALISSLCCTLGSNAIIIRHDVDDERYSVSPDEFPALITIGNAHGTLIAPQWVLTAAHVVETYSPNTRELIIAGRSHKVDRVVLHDTWTSSGLPGVGMPHWVDLALLHLATPVDTIEPARINTDPNESGSLVTFYGTGMTGDGYSGPTTRDSHVRRAHNTIDHVEPDWLVIPFDAPPHALPLEGISGPGDSGGPAIIEIEGEPVLAGVSSRNDPGELAECTYGTTERYARVSAHSSWIHAITDENSTFGAIIQYENEFPASSKMNDAALAWLDAARMGTLEAFTEFENRWVMPENAESRATRWARMFRPGGSLRVESFSQMNTSVLTLYVSTSDTTRAIRFAPNMNNPTRLQPISTRRMPPTKGPTP